jgi:uncharacterized protein (TIGR03118 family)
MKKPNESKTMPQKAPFIPFAAILSLASLTLGTATVGAQNNQDEGSFYRKINLVSDQPGVAKLQDTNLVNAWGTSFSASSPFWVSDNGSGLATLYTVTNDASGQTFVSKVSLEVHIPGAGTPTGQVFNGATNSFHGDAFLFVSEDGTISGWRPALGTNAEILITRSNAVYKGATLVSTTNGPLLLVANFREATLDAYDGTVSLVAQYADPAAPAGYAPFNVQVRGGIVFVTFAKQDAQKHDDDPGRGHGLIDVFDLATQTFHRLVTGSDAGGSLGAINSPWGVAISPSTFGPHADQLLVGNFGSGTIMTFNASGQFQGFLRNRFGNPLFIDGLWALTFGNGGRGGVPGTLYFTAGPDSESHGLFGSIDVVRINQNGQGQNQNGQGQNP